MTHTDIPATAAVAAVSPARNRRGSRQDDEPQTVSAIVEEGQLVYLDPPRPDIEAALVTQTFVVEDDREHGYKIDRQQASLLAPKLASPTAGLVPDAFLRRQCSVLGSIRVTRADELLDTLAEGGSGYHFFGKSAQKVVLRSRFGRLPPNRVDLRGATFPEPIA